MVKSYLCWWTQPYIPLISPSYIPWNAHGWWWNSHVDGKCLRLMGDTHGWWSYIPSIIINAYGWSCIYHISITTNFTDIPIKRIKLMVHAYGWWMSMVNAYAWCLMPMVDGIKSPSAIINAYGWSYIHPYIPLMSHWYPHHIPWNAHGWW